MFSALTFIGKSSWIEDATMFNHRMTYTGRFTVTPTFIKYLESTRPGTDWDREFTAGDVLSLFQEKVPAAGRLPRYRLDCPNGRPSVTGYDRQVGPGVPCLVLDRHPSLCQPLDPLSQLPHWVEGELLRGEGGDFRIVRREGFLITLEPVGRDGAHRIIDIDEARAFQMFVSVPEGQPAVTHETPGDRGDNACPNA